MKVPGSHFRLEKSVIADLDLIAARLTETRGIRHSRADAVRHAATECARRMRRATSARQAEKPE